MTPLTTQQEKAFQDQGFLVIPDALSPTHVSRLTTVLDAISKEKPEKIYNEADILGLRDEFLDMIDLPTVLPKVQQLLGRNIWVNHTHYNINPASPRGGSPRVVKDYGWHRDGGIIHEDLGLRAPLLSIKVGFYLTDISDIGHGETYIIQGSHQTGEKPPLPHEFPSSAHPILVKSGSAVFFDQRVIHSIRSPNPSPDTRHVIFIQYAFRWLSPVDAMTVAHLRNRCNPVRLQLLGLSTTTQNIDGAAGRSGRYHPSPHEVPLGLTYSQQCKKKLWQQFRWWKKQFMNKLSI